MPNTSASNRSNPPALLREHLRGARFDCAKGEE
jgi:hypothetical protein